MTSRERAQSDVVGAQVRKLLGIRGFKPAHVGFDPLKASDRALRLHGYPARPDAKAQPRLHEQWTRMLSQPWQMIEPQFAPISDKAHGSRQTYGLPTGDGWGGAISFAERGDTVTFVSGQWTVPHIVTPKPGNAIVANWIGIDGATNTPGIDGSGSGDILQAGTTQLIFNTPLSQFYESFAWFEWYPAPPVEITNLRVSPGDTLYCVICVISPTDAGIHMLNVTTGIGTSFIKSAPKGVALVGNCAEWVIEDPISSGMNLGRFGSTYFDECLAGTQAGKLLLGGTGDIHPLFDVNGQMIASPTAETDLLIRVRYTDAAP